MYQFSEDFQIELILYKLKRYVGAEKGPPYIHNIYLPMTGLIQALGKLAEKDEINRKNSEKELVRL